MSTPHCVIRRGLFDRWFIFHPSNRDPHLAWSGSRWVTCTEDGLPCKPDHTQVCNFETEADAREYCGENGLEPIEPAV